MIKVTCAIIEHKDKTLVVQRSDKMKHPNKWEFPGGKIESNETEEECIKREINEELNISITLHNRLRPNFHKYDSAEILLIPFISSYNSGILKLNEHKDYRWLHKAALLDLDWVAADLPIVKEYINYE